MNSSDAAGRRSLLERVIASVESRWVTISVILVCGVLAGSFEYLTHLAVARLRPPLQFHAGVDAFVIACLTMTLVGVVIATARARRRQVMQEMHTVAELNHHVRNALQVIRDSHLLPEDKQAQAVIESVDRIDRTLRRLFPPATTAYNEQKAAFLQGIVAESKSEVRKEDSQGAAAQPNTLGER